MTVSITMGYRVLTRLGLCAVVLVSALCITDALFTGKVVKIADGDTLNVLVDRQQIRVRLAEIDCPERAQPWSNKSKRALSEHVFGKVVEIVPEAKDRYGRTVATVIVNGVAVNRAIIQGGHC